ncbi:MAG: hypothetical protein JWO67_4770 [Streptosporangiaceae bacterium]|jgi:hypothetical membrane protein|nr:hypothetical protein [Streptosporangiaceae bacterium]
MPWLGLRRGGAVSPGGRTDSPGVVPVLCAVLAATAGITYSSFLLESFLSPDLDVIDGYASELSAVDQPFHWVYNAGDFTTGVLAIIVAATALITLRRRPWAVIGWTFLLLFGVSVIGDASFPLDCAPSLETTCALRERADQVSFSHQFHAVTSGSVITCAIIALFALSIAARRYGWWPSLARWGWWLAIAEVISALGTLCLMVSGTWLGLAQRFQIVVLCLSLLLIARALYDDRRTRHRTDGRTEQRREDAVAGRRPRLPSEVRP